MAQLTNGPISIVPSSRVDKTRWDHCVASDTSALIYSSSWYMDALAEEWHGLIAGDYSAVLPLPVKKRGGLRMIYMPPFMQRLDVAGAGYVRLDAVGKAITDFCRLVSFSSSQVLFPGSVLHRQRTNLVLSLTASYASISDKYSSQCRKNLRQAMSRGCLLVDDLSVNDVIVLYRKAYGNVSSYAAHHFSLLGRMLAGNPGRYHVRGVRDASGALVYAGLLLDDGKRLYYVLGAPTEQGRRMRATYFFIDAVIRQFAESGMVFDFEGSDIPSVAGFYHSFSPDSEYYNEFYYNSYPFPFNKLLDRKLKPF